MSPHGLPGSAKVDAVPPIVGLATAALISFALAVPAVALLGRAAGRMAGRSRRAYQLLAVSVGVGVVGLAGTAVLAAFSVRPGSPVQALPVSAGMSLSGAAAAAALLLLPGATDRPGSLLRHVLDGSLLAACGLHASWTLVIEPLHARYLRGSVPFRLTPACLVVAVPSIVVLVAGGIGTVSAWRASRPRTGLVLCAVLVGITGLAGTGLVFAARYGDGASAFGTSLVYGLGLIGLAEAARYTDRVIEPDPEIPGPGTALALIPASGAILAAIIRLVVFHGTDNISIMIAAVVGGLLTTRQTIATRDAYRHSQRWEAREAEMREMAYTDALTGLGNRRQLLRVLQEQAVGGPPCVLVAIDLDGFKSVNDIRGHDVGDAVLVEVASRLRAHTRPGDLATRLGGDEFAVLMWAGVDEAHWAAERLLTVLCQPYEVAGGVEMFLSASLGLAGCATADDVPTLLHNADLSLRFAKQRGKNRIERYDAAYDQWMRRRTVLEQELRGAIDRAELSLVYQPVVRLPEGRPVGVETLLRWRHPTLGSVPPAEFIPVAEESGLIGQLDRWVLHQACHQLAAWLAEGLDVWVAVNMSVRELHFPDYVSQVVEVLRAHRVPAGRLVLEVTEHAVALDLDEMVDRLAALRDVGVRVALDDFGAGYSSLGQLRRMPVDILKIDHSLVTEPGSDQVGTTAPLVDVVARLGRRLGLDVIAEGVAGPRDRAVVEAAGCPLAQGDHFGRPAPAEHVEALLTAAAPVLPGQRPAQDLGQVDSGHEMRQS